MSALGAIAWGVAVAGVLAVVARRVRAAAAPGPSTCARCGGAPDLESGSCTACGRDLRQAGIVPGSASLVPRVAYRCMLWTVALPLYGWITAVIVGSLAMQLRWSWFGLSSPVQASAEAPLSGAYGAIRISVQSGYRDLEPYRQHGRGFLILGIEDDDGDRVGTLMALRAQDRWTIETRDGPELDAAALAAWMQSHCADLDDLDAAREAADVMTLVEAAGHASAWQQVRGVSLDRFATVATPNAGGASWGGVRGRHDLQAVIAVWLAGLLVIALWPARRGGRAAAAAALAVSCGVSAAGCEQYLMATPNVCAWTGTCSLAEVPEALRTGAADVLFATDRLEYGRGRGDEIVYGVATVDLAGDLSWDELVVESSRKARRAKPIVRTETVRAFAAPGEGAFLDALARRLAVCAEKQAFLYVHGFNSPFERGAQTIAQLWHFAGRRGVPVAYCWPSWPLGAGGGRSYSWDYESSIFTVGHFKHVLELLASCPGLERVTIIAHSRGADVVLTALRELLLAGGGDAQDTRERLKLGAVILAAPDIDVGVMRQRVIAEGVHEVPRRLVIYFSRDDWPLRTAEWITGDTARLGGRGAPSMAGHGLQLIEVRVTGYSRTDHDYFCAHPAVSSDLILVMRGRLDAGPGTQRPLTTAARGTWLLTNDYPGVD